LRLEDIGWGITPHGPMLKDASCCPRTQRPSNTFSSFSLDILVHWVDNPYSFRVTPLKLLPWLLLFHVRARSAHTHDSQLTQASRETEFELIHPLIASLKCSLFLLLGFATWLDLGRVDCLLGGLLKLNFGHSVGLNLEGGVRSSRRRALETLTKHGLLSLVLNSVCNVGLNINLLILLFDLVCLEGGWDLGLADGVPANDLLLLMLGVGSRSNHRENDRQQNETVTHSEDNDA